MKCRIKAFGIAREIIGQRELELELDSAMNVTQLKELLHTRYPAIKSLKSVFIALNNEYAEEYAVVQEGDEIALIPPVSGG